MVGRRSAAGVDEPTRAWNDISCCSTPGLPVGLVAAENGGSGSGVHQVRGGEYVWKDIDVSNGIVRRS